MIISFKYLTEPPKEQTAEYQYEQSLLRDIEKLEQELKEEKERGFEARVKCVELEQKLKSEMTG